MIFFNFFKNIFGPCY